MWTLSEERLQGILTEAAAAIAVCTECGLGIVLSGYLISSVSQ